MSKKLLFVVNLPWFFLSHRFPVALAATASGYDVQLWPGAIIKLHKLPNSKRFVSPLTLATGIASNGREL